MRLRAWALATATTTCLLAGCADSEAEPGAGAAESAGKESTGGETTGGETTGGKSTGEAAAAADEDLVTEGAQTEDLLVHGAVTRDGEPVEDAAVRVMLMPEDLDSLEVGDEVPMWETPPAETGEDGRYAVRLDPEEIDEEFFRPGSDYLNFSLRVESDGVMAEWAATAWLVGEDGVWRSSGAEVADPVVEMSVDLGAETIAMTDSQGETSEEELSVFEAPQR